MYRRQVNHHHRSLEPTAYTAQVPDGSSVDISRTIRFDYGDPVYSKLAKEAYDEWVTSPHYSGTFKQTPFVLASSDASGRAYINKCSSSLDAHGLPWSKCHSAEDVKSEFPELSGTLAPNYYGYYNRDAGWADAERAIANLRDRCIESGVSFLSGPRGTVTGLNQDATGKVTSVLTESDVAVPGDIFVLAAGAWTSRLVPMHQSILATGQVLGFMKLSAEEMDRYNNMPIYMNFSSGWFSFPPHERTGYLKFAVHGLGYTRSAQANNSRRSVMLSSPPSRPRHVRKNFAPLDGVDRLRAGLKEVIPELASRPFDRVAVCWYTDTPTGDFIVDYHPDHNNLLIATGGSGQYVYITRPCSGDLRIG